MKKSKDQLEAQIHHQLHITLWWMG